MSRNPKNCGVCGRENHPHHYYLYNDNYGFPPGFEQNFVRERWFNGSVCQACGLNFFKWFKIHMHRSSLPKFSFYDFRDNPECVFMFWMVKMLRADIMICANGGSIRYCENPVKGNNCRNRASEVENGKHLCGICYPLSPALRVAIQRENEERTIRERRRVADEIREETIIRLEKWHKKHRLKKRRESLRFCWLSLPC